MARLSHNQRTLLCFAVVAAGLVATGCQDVDWDWESRWWQKPTREVKPDRRVARDGRTTPPPKSEPPPPVAASTATPVHASPSESRSAPAQTVAPGSSEVVEVQSDERVELTTNPPPSQKPAPSPAPEVTPPPVRTEPAQVARSSPQQNVSIAPPEPAPAQRSITPALPPEPASRRPAEEQIASARSSERMSIPDRAPSPSPSVSPQPPAVPASPPSAPILSNDPDAFYQLYLLSEPSSQRAAPNTQRIQLANAPSRAAAQIISQLYQPVGLGGGEKQTYLIYQDLAEWRAAQAAVALVDVPTGGGTPLNRGVRSLIDVVSAGPMPDREAVSAAHAAFSHVAADRSADSRSRWAAAMWDGKLSSEQLFDDTAAAAAFDVAIQLAGPGSVERLAAMWARAESYQAVGDRESAKKAYAALSDEFSGAHPRSQAVQRATALRAGGGR